MPEPKLVGSGGFRVDRKRALATLASRRFVDPTVFVDCWIRCAEASRARLFECGAGDRALEFSIAAPIEGLADDLWAPIFDPKPRTLAAGQLAQGALACLASKPSRLVVASSGLRLTVESLERVRVERDAAARQTRISVAWPRGKEPAWADRLRSLRLWLGRCSGSGVLEAAPPAAPEEPALAFRRGHLRYRLAPRSVEEGASLVRFYKLGVWVETFEERLPMRVCLDVNDDLAELSVDLSRVLPGERRERALELARAHLPRLAAHAARWVGPRFRRAARRLEDPKVLAFWQGRSALYPTADDLASSWAKSGKSTAWQLPGLSEEERRDLVLAGWTADWLHLAPPDLVHHSPLFFAGGGKTMTLRQVEAESQEQGVVRFSRQPGVAPVWCPSGREIAWLTRHFGGALREV